MKFQQYYSFTDVESKFIGFRNQPATGAHGIILKLNYNRRINLPEWFKISDIILKKMDKDHICH